MRILEHLKKKENDDVRKEMTKSLNKFDLNNKLFLFSIMNLFFILYLLRKYFAWIKYTNWFEFNLSILHFTRMFNLFRIKSKHIPSKEESSRVVLCFLFWFLLYVQLNITGCLLNWWHSSTIKFCLNNY